MSRDAKTPATPEDPSFDPDEEKGAETILAEKAAEAATTPKSGKTQDAPAA